MGKTEFLSWNICGLQKLARFPSVFATILATHVVFLQETLQVSSTFNFPGFTRFDVPAIESPGRSSGGLATLLANSVFSAASFEVLVAEPFLQLIAVTSPNTAAALFANIYIPRFSRGTSPQVYSDVLEHLVTAIEVTQPSICIIAGDWNAHPHAPTSPFDRAFLQVESVLSELG
jgi:exonuclease III